MFVCTVLIFNALSPVVFDYCLDAYVYILLYTMYVKKKFKWKSVICNIEFIQQILSQFMEDWS